jgi:peptide/nickel transport system permease protein
MAAAGAEFGVKGVLRELLTYKSGLFGVIILCFLVAISVYTVIAIPYDKAVELWRGEAAWTENPRNAQPLWVKYITGVNLPETIKRDTADPNKVGIYKAITDISGTDLKRIHIELSFNYEYDDFPSEINLFFSSNYSGSAPILRISWVKPDGENLKLLDYIPRSFNDKLYLSINREVQLVLNTYMETVLGKGLDVILPVEKALFIAEDKYASNLLEADPLKGKYKLVIKGTLFGEGSDVDVRLIVYGKVYGLCGTDHLRRDLLVAILWGTPIALSFGLIASLTITFLQLLIATISGYYGGWIDSLIQRLTELYMILPFLPFLIMIATFYKLDIWILLAAIIILNIFGGGIKSTRALVMQIKEYPYIEAAMAYGASSKRIVLLYIIPKILPPVIPGLIGAVPGYVFLEAALSFLGLGDPFLPTWGKVINDSHRLGALYKGYYYWVLQPAFMLVLTAFAFAFIGFALDKIVNPKLREI